MRVEVSKIKPNPNNPRICTEAKFKKLVQSLRDFPQMLDKRPLVCVTDADGVLMVLGGNMRLKAAQSIGMKDIPVVIADDWTEEQRKRFTISDNVSAGWWDFDDLANLWDENDLMEFGIDLPIDEFKLDEEQEEKKRKSWSLKIKLDNEDEALNLCARLMQEGFNVTLNN